MPTKRQKEQKKKQKERDTYKKVLTKRLALRTSRKEQKEQQQKEAEAHKIVHGRQKPIVNSQSPEIEAAKSQVIVDRLHKNLEILQALEQEYESEQAVREELNEKLESEGHNTLKEKMDALHEKALQMTNKAELLAEAQQEYALQQTEIKNNSK